MRVVVKLDKITKSFGDKVIIKDLSLDIFEGEFLTLLGPSGCGKTTILRIISGLEHVTSGKVFIDDVDVTDVDPMKREVNTIFQNFALFPHMSVWDNVAFGLKMKKVSKDEISKRVGKILKLVKLEGYEDRFPGQLSGGQQQRVAIARGVVMNPKVLLLDESLCSLDLKLKRAMQIELKKIQKKLGITFIYVTHDQDEALTMSDRIVIIDKGIIQQKDTPQNIYMYPKTTFVADFIGESNIMNGEIIDIKNNSSMVRVEDDIIFEINKIESDELGKKINILVRPENIRVSSNILKNAIHGIVQDVIYDGAITKLFVDTDGKLNLRVNVHGIVNFKEGDDIYLKIDRECVVPIRGRDYEKR